jgi:outer membrane protein, multidrug efflux system
VLSALTDSEIAANRFAASLATQHDRASAAKEAQAAAELAALRFRKGEDDRIQMLEANSAAIQAGLLASASSADAAAAFVSFSKALGGGVK